MLNPVQALAYARDRLPPFLNDPDPAPAIVSQVMGLFAFAHLLTSGPSPPASCPYSHQLQQWQLPSLARDLHSAILSAAGLPAASPLHECVRMGTQALAPLLKCAPATRRTAARFSLLFHGECCPACRYAAMLKAQERQVWANPSAIPFQLCDDATPQHHSVFVCPVSREKNSLADPPVRLTCGHMLLHSSMTRLGKPPQGRFKCP